MFANRRSREPERSVSLPRLFSVQPPFHLPWSSYWRGYPCPGRVSTLLNHAYSTPPRLVHACLQVTEQVWQPMHLSRFITMLIWAITRMSVLDLLAGAAPDDGDLVALVTGRAEVVERERQLRVT